jgi:hypothetical protein
MAIMDLSFTGGCALATLVFAPLLWPRAMLRNIALGSLLATLLIALGWLNLGLQVGGSYARRENWLLVDTQLALCIAGGISMLALAIVDYRDRRDAASAFLALWVLGTFAFAAFINYTVNARSVLPLIPAAGILIARRIEETCVAHLRNKIAVALVLCAAVSLVVASADASLANSARRAARLIIEKTHARVGALWFEGHWGFQYYMEQAGAEALNLRQPQLRPRDILALPSNNIQTRGINPKLIASREQLELDLSGWAATIDGKHRAGFYSAYWGPLPYIIVRPPVERYEILQIADHARLK